MKKRIKNSIAIGLASSLGLGFGCSSPETDSGCEEFGVYAQNRWEPLGTAVRADPDIMSEQVNGYQPNEIIYMDGWYDSGEPVYPNNTEPWNSGVWLRIAGTDELWVSFAGVRGEETIPDYTGYQDGGKPATLPSDCLIEDI